MTKNQNLKKCTNDTNKIILYVVFMTTLFLLYCSGANNEIENSIDYHSAEYQSYNGNVITSENSNIPTFCKHIIIIIFYKQRMYTYIFLNYY